MARTTFFCMGPDVYRCSAAVKKAEIERIDDGDGAGDELVPPLVLLLLTVLLLVGGFVGGKDHATESGLGVLGVMVTVWWFVDALRARRQRDRMKSSAS